MMMTLNNIGDFSQNLQTAKEHLKRYLLNYLGNESKL